MLVTNCLSITFKVLVYFMVLVDSYKLIAVFAAFVPVSLP
jgi:hypothetical protein